MQDLELNKCSVDEVCSFNDASLNSILQIEQYIAESISSGSKDEFLALLDQLVQMSFSTNVV